MYNLHSHLIGGNLLILPNAMGNPKGIEKIIVRKNIFKETLVPSKSAGHIFKKYSHVSAIFVSPFLLYQKKAEKTFGTLFIKQFIFIAQQGGEYSAPYNLVSNWFYVIIYRNLR
jgi:hypothetical protein